MIAAVNGRKRMLGAFLQACRFDGATDTHVVLAMDDLHRAVVDEKENRAHHRRRGGARVRTPADRCSVCRSAGEAPRGPDQRTSNRSSTARSRGSRAT